MSSPRLLAPSAVVLSALAFAAAHAVSSLPLPTSISDFRQPGSSLTDPNAQPILPSSNCQVCHGGYDVDQEPYTRWAASLMAQSIRDPVFRATLAIANQDMNGAGYLCLRCHAPGGFLGGRGQPDGGALDNAQGDFDGTNCHVCHRLVDPFYEAGASPPIDQQILAALPLVPFSIGNGQMVVDPADVRRGPFDLGPNFFLHDWLPSPFHRESLLCATCHEVSNPQFSRQPDGTYALNAFHAQHPTHDKRDEFPIERTFGEWEQSVYAQAPIDTNGRFGGTAPTVSTCQDCHMPKTTGTACQPVLGGAVRTDLPLHDFQGANSWVLDAVRNLYPDSESGLSTQSVADAHARNADMLARALDLELYTIGTDLGVRIVNQSGHKLPTGYGEGRRMWIHVRFLDAQGALVGERGAYDSATATLTTADTKVYEIRQGLDAAMAAATGVPQGASFHFTLNNTTVLDNRIPPRGFSNAAFDSVQAKPVGVVVEEQQYWDDTLYTAPAGAVTAVVDVYHQTTSREYIEFIRDTDTTDNLGQLAYDQWVFAGKSAPVLMGTRTIDLVAGACRSPVPYGVSKRLAAGGYPRLFSSGSPTVAVNDFAVEIWNAKAGVLAVLFSSDGPATTPFAGAFLYLASPLTRVSTFQFDATGSATIPIHVTPGMAGTELHYQAVFRDVQAQASLGLTNGLHVDFCL
ncbi:MAG TPA: multiheme c-type cytochrome [Planctomycetota bacterium]|nr:multiheme c-type cytochrome [Planctomycetota bacterium]